MTAENDGHGQSVLRWERVSVPEALEMVLVDISNNKTLRLGSPEAADEYAFVERGLNRFKLILGHPDYVDGAVEEVQATLPSRFSLSPNYPNPFNPSTRISYEVAVSGEVNLRIYNVLGQAVRTLVQDFRDTGKYTVEWDGKDEAGNNLPSGVYLFRFQAGGVSRVEKGMLIK